jgi:uncharacterized repeat protein (TIGR03806 family)
MPHRGVHAFLGFPRDADDWAQSPRALSQTGAFTDLETLDVQDGILPYSVQSPLFSDGALKRRWLALPSGSQIGFSERDHWRFPEGSVLIKHFEIALDERSPEELWRLETRFLVAARGGGYYGLVYKWDNEQRDAELLVDGGDEALSIVERGGSTRQQTYSYPPQSTCVACHSEAVGYVRGARTSQLNGEPELAPTPGASEPRNQLTAWAEIGAFDEAFGDEPLPEYPRLTSLDDESASVEARVRSYWDTHCAMCHHGHSPLSSWDARYETPLSEQGVLMAEPHAPRGDDVRLVVPGDPLRSLIYLRASAQPGMRMPPLLRSRVDALYLAVLERWILGLPAE